MEDPALGYYPVYFIVSTLKAMGWPRKNGLFARSGVAGDALRGAWRGMVQASMGLGAGRPSLACRLLTKLFTRRDWTRESGDDLISALDPAKYLAPQTDSLPWDEVVQKYLDVTPDFIPWSQVTAEEIVNIWIPQCAAGLIYGLAHPSAVGAALERDRATYASNAPELIKYGLNIPPTPPFPDNESFFQWAEQTVHAHEARFGSLPQPAQQLMAAAVVRARGAGSH
jgi:hypothetical protein